jgi:DNA modification methylase
MLDCGFYNMDCMDGMKEFPDKYFDLAIVDVPYGIGENGNKNHSRSVLGISKDYKAFYGEDLKAPGKEYFNELFRVSKNQISAALFGGFGGGGKPPPYDYPRTFPCRAGCLRPPGTLRISAVLFGC